MNIRLSCSIISALLLAGCSTFSGLDASSDFACKARPGVSCQSISGVHQNASAGNLPFQRGGEETTDATGNDPEKKEAKNDADGEKKSPPKYGATKTGTPEKVSPRDMNAAYSGMPVRQPPLVLRVWMAPYEDESGDLYDQSYFYTMVHSGRWMIEANRSSIGNQYRPIYPLVRPNRNTTTDEPDQEKKPLVRSQEYNNLVEKPNREILD